MTSTLADFSYWFAFLLSIGSLVFYLFNAFLNRTVASEKTDQSYEFNLGLPGFRSRESLFSISLVAAGTSLSTVFVFFLTASSVFGWWVLLSPVLFALGNWVMFVTYRRLDSLGYLDETTLNVSGAGGLVPFLGQRITGSPVVATILVGLSVINLLAVLVLELVVGVEVLGYLSRNALHTQGSASLDFVVFALSVLLLLGYVSVGGFRAVVISDVWQMKAMRWAVMLGVLSLVVLVLRSHISLAALSALSRAPGGALLAGFVLNVILANLFSPLSQEASWQRFRAFTREENFDTRAAISRSVLSAVTLWAGLIALAFMLELVVGGAAAGKLSSMAAVLEAFRTVNDWWFPLFVFPLLTVASLSAMYSTADTCVSALLYLLEYWFIVRHAGAQVGRTKGLRARWLAMIMVLVLSLGVFSFVRLWFKPTILQLVFSVFSNLVVIAPTVLLGTRLRPDPTGSFARRRQFWTLMSLGLGFVTYWLSAILAIALGGDYLWLSQLSIVAGLAGSSLPMVPLLLREETA